MSFYDDASLIVYPSGYKESKIYAQKPVPSYGAELVTNGDFSDGTNGWQGTDAGSLLSVVLGKLKVENGDASAAGANSSITTEIGKEYKISFVSTKGTAINGILFGAGTSTNSVNLLNVTDTFDGIHNGTFTATTTTTWFIAKTLSTTSGEYCYIDNVSVKEVLVAPADLTFTRASSATRVNAEGLIEEASVLGSELVTNGDFATDSDWTKGTGWSISGGKANSSSTSSASITQNVGITLNKTYKVTYTVSNYVSGEVRSYAGGYQNGDLNASNGTFTDTITVITGASNSLLYIEGTSNFIGSIDNVSVKEAITSNVPRIDYTGGGCGSLLLEPQSTNLITYSEDFTQGWSLSSATIISNSTTAPDGLSNGSTLTTSAFGGGLVETLSASNGNITFSLFVKKGTTNGIRLRIDAATDSNGFFDLVNNTVYSSDDEASIESFGNNWYRISISANITSFSKVAIYTTDGSDSYENGSVYIYGAQLEQSSYATSYIISNSGTTTTRLADTASKTGISSLINDSEGVLYAESSTFTDSPSSDGAISVNDGGVNSKYVLIQFRTDGKIWAFIKGGTAISYEANLTEPHKIAVRWKSDLTFDLYVDGSLRASSTYSSSLTNLSVMSFNAWTTIQPFYGNVQNLMVFPSALTDDELADLTGAVHQTFNSLATFYNYTIL